MCGVGKVKIEYNPSVCGMECNPPHPSSIPLSAMLSYTECIVVMALSPIVNLALCPKEYIVYRKYHPWNEGEEMPQRFPQDNLLEKKGINKPRLVKCGNW